MDPFHLRLARVALLAAESYGFCLAGGYAVRAHGFVERRSDDVDLFTTMAAADRFTDAVRAVVKAFEKEGLTVTVTQDGTSSARLSVSDALSGAASRIELGIDWRAFPPARLEAGMDPITDITPLVYEESASFNVRNAKTVLVD